jgi:hypothetical protein
VGVYLEGCAAKKAIYQCKCDEEANGVDDDFHIFLFYHTDLQRVVLRFHEGRLFDLACSQELII